jgi:hypothetical protein
MASKGGTGVLALAISGALVSCGSSAKPPCVVLSNGNQLCGNAAAAWCQIPNSAVDDPTSTTHRACETVSKWANRGRRVVTVGPSPNGTGLTSSTTGP